MDYFVNVSGGAGEAYDVPLSRAESWTLPSLGPIPVPELLATPPESECPPSPTAPSTATESAEHAVKVVLRVRPPLARELHGYEPYRSAVRVDPNGTRVSLCEANPPPGDEASTPAYGAYTFNFDRVYGPEATQAQVYDESARSAVLSVLSGYNASIIAYGQTGTGKTHTMEGTQALEEPGSLRSRSGSQGSAGLGSSGGHPCAGRAPSPTAAGSEAGIVPRAIEDVFAGIARASGPQGDGSRFLVRASYLQIYNEAVTDLLKPGGKSLVVRDARRRGAQVEGLSEWVVRSPGEVATLMRAGAAARATGSTRLNAASSRSHAIFQLIVERQRGLAGEEGAGGAGGRDGGAAPAKGAGRAVCVGKLNLVDLAGSERVHVTGATGLRLEESKKINSSLSTLGNVISALTEPRGRDRGHVPYRDSKLTRILEDSLGGNCRTTFLAMVSPAAEAFSESLSTLKFAHRAKRVRNAPHVNEDLDQKTLLRRYELELKRLRAELAQRGRDLVDRRLVLEVDAARRREQADKLAAIQALERQAAEIARHKATMARLQDRIAVMQSQLLGGAALSETPAFRAALADEQRRVRAECRARVAELEAERAALAQGAAQGERYRALLLKQRDIMAALTDRLGERDAQILALQGALDAAGDRLQRLGDALDASNADLLDARRQLAEETRERGGESLAEETRDRCGESLAEETRERGGESLASQPGLCPSNAGVAVPSDAVPAHSSPAKPLPSDSRASPRRPALSVESGPSSTLLEPPRSESGSSASDGSRRSRTASREPGGVVRGARGPAEISRLERSPEPRPRAEPAPEDPSPAARQLAGPSWSIASWPRADGSETSRSPLFRAEPGRKAAVPEGAPGGRSAASEQHLARLERERAALVQILGRKMAGLVSDVRRRVAAAGVGEEGDGVKASLDNLSKLIGATAAALKPEGAEAQ